MSAKTVVVVGSTGDVGQWVVDCLTRHGHHIRPVSRRVGVSLDDAAAIRGAFAGADSAFVMIPFDLRAQDLHRREDEIGANVADAVKTAGVRRVVLLSGTSAHLKSGSSLGAAIMEDRLEHLGIPELVHLRGAFFMENFLKMGLVEQATTGTFATAFSPDIATPMIAARDVGERAAELLSQEPRLESGVRELLGARDYTMREATQLLGSAIGKPDLEYAQVPYGTARRAMVDGGASTSFADAVMDTTRSLNEREVWATEARTGPNTTATTMQRWAQDTLLPAYLSSKEGSVLAPGIDR